MNLSIKKVSAATGDRLTIRFGGQEVDLAGGGQTDRRIQYWR